MTSTSIVLPGTKEYRDLVGTVSSQVIIDGREVHIQPDRALQVKKRLPRRERKSTIRRIAKILGLVKEKEEVRRNTTYLSCVVPAYNEQLDIKRTLDSLLLQTRPIDQIVVVVNNTHDKTADIVRLYAQEFPHIICVDNPDYQTRHGRTVTVKGKVAALNYYWRHYVAIEEPRGSEEFVLGIDADVALAEDCIELLEKTLLDDEHNRIGGVRAAYGFEVPENADFRTRGLVKAQQLDFAATELSDQLRRGNRANILGGQATLFRREALEAVATANKGEGPWYADTTVEDAYLTREFERRGYIGVVNSKARATVGAMHTAKALQSQRSKWQNGHLEDLAGDTKHAFSYDRYRWGLQFVLGWNWVLRMTFFALLTTAVAANAFVFNPLWVVPLALAMVLNALIALRMHNRSTGLVVRAGTYVLPEIHVWRTLGVWLMSLPRGARALVAGGRADLSDWEKQANAETDNRRGGYATWVTFYSSILLPMAAIMATCFMLPGLTSTILSVGWSIVGWMSVVSSAFMAIKIMRILKNYSRLSL